MEGEDMQAIDDDEVEAAHEIMKKFFTDKKLTGLCKLLIQR